MQEVFPKPPVSPGSVPTSLRVAFRPVCCWPAALRKQHALTAFQEPP